MGKPVNDQRLAGYRLAERLAVGGMAEVFRGERLGPGGFAKPVAIKRVLPDLAKEPRFVAMFLEEARIAAQLSCPNLIQVFDFGEEGGSYFMVMEYVDGVDLAGLTSSAGVLAVDVVIHLGRSLGNALDHIHTAAGPDGRPLGIVHRDVTPANVLVSRAGDVKLGDFGIAKSRARAARTESGTVKGKLAYLSPEQARGDPVDARTDIYGLGLLLFEMLTGERYLDAENEPDLLRLAERPARRRVAEHREVSRTVDEAIARALAPEPERRFPSARLLAEALGPLEKSESAVRDQLGGLVRSVRGGASESVGGRGVRSPPLERRGVIPGPVTEVVDRGARIERRGVPVLLGVLLLAGSVVGGLWWLAGAGWWERPENRELMIEPAVPVTRESSEPAAGSMKSQVVRAPDRASAPPAKGHRGTSDRAGVPGSGLAPTDVVAWPATRARDGASPQAAGRGREAAPTDAANRAPDTASPVTGGGAAENRLDKSEPVAMSQNAAREILADIRAVIINKGLLAADIPELTRRLADCASAVDADVVPHEDLRVLLADLASVVIDHAFIDAKLQRVSARLAAKRLPADAQKDARRRSQAALSHSVNGRYDLANQELNGLVSLLERH